MLFRFRINKLVCIIILFGSSACSTSKVEIQSTIQVHSINSISTLKASQTTQPYPTHTPYPSSTPFPTATDYPTTAPYSTQAPYPTASPYPTSTPYPTLEITPTISSNAQLPGPIPLQTAADNYEKMLQILIDYRAGFQSFGGLIDESIAAGNPSLNCRPLISLYNNFSHQIALDITGDQQNVQNAYHKYIEAVNLFRDQSNSMVENCNKQFAGEPTGGISTNQWELARQAVDDAISLLEPQIRKLGGR